MVSKAEKTDEIRNYNEFAAALKQGERRSLYLLYGNEPYLIEKALKALFKNNISPDGKELDFYEANWDGRNMTPEKLYELFSTPPFVSSKRMVVLHGSEILYGKSNDTSGTWDSYLSVLRKITDMSCLVFVENHIDKRKKSLIKAFSAVGSIIQIDQQKIEDLSKWVGVILSRQKIRVSIDAVHSLVLRNEMNMRVIENELKKIILYCKYNHLSEIGVNDIDTLCIPDIRGSIFQMTDAIGGKNFQKALELLSRLISQREPVTKIRFMLARHIRQLICAKEHGKSDGLAAVLKIPPYIAKKLLEQAKKFELEELTNLYIFCAERDYQVKTGQMEERIALEAFLCSFSA